MTKSDRDRSIEQLLRRSLASDEGASGAGCPDAETLAALAEDTLAAAPRREIEAHLADCRRCQALTAAMMRAGASAGTTAGSAAVAWWRRRRVINWLAPAAAAATAVALLVALPSRNTPPLAQFEPSPRTAEAPAAAPAQATARDALKPPADARADLPAAALEAEQRALKAESTVAGAAPAELPPPASAPAASVPAPPAARSNEETDAARREGAASAAEDSLGRQRASAVGSLAVADAAGARLAAGFEVVSPDPKIRWRVTPAAGVQYSADGGVSWAPQQTGMSTELTAGSSPAPAVCWLVGRAGTVLRTADGGSRWLRVPFPETADLTAVVGSTELGATVDLADGRRLGTGDGGQTWSIRRD